MTGRKFILGCSARTSRPTKVPGSTDNPPRSVQLEVPPCHARSMVNYARTRMLINKRRFSKNLLIDSFGGGTLSTGTKRIAVVLYLLNLR
jgi:hypothetical protein